MFFENDSEEVVRMKCQLINMEMERIHKSIKSYEHPDTLYINMLKGFKAFVTTINKFNPLN